MKTIVTTTYQCEVCKAIHGSAAAAIDCESKPILRDKGAKVGDIVRITQGGGQGEKAVVESLGICQAGWGPESYTHTRSLTAKCIESYGNRHLTFDSYELIRKGAA